MLLKVNPSLMGANQLYATCNMFAAAYGVVQHVLCGTRCQLQAGFKPYFRCVYLFSVEVIPIFMHKFLRC